MKQVMIKQEQGNFSGEAIAPDGDVPRTGLAAMAEQRNSMGRPPGGGGGELHLPAGYPSPKDVYRLWCERHRHHRHPPSYFI